MHFPARYESVYIIKNIMNEEKTEALDQSPIRNTSNIFTDPTNHHYSHFSSKIVPLNIE